MYSFLIKKIKMKPNNLILCFLLLTSSVLAKAQNANISIDNPDPMQVCNLTTTTLKAYIDFTGTGKNATISVVLPEGITYIAKSIKATKSSKAQLKIVESNLANLSKPIFTVQGNILPSDYIEFTISKTATCSATKNSILTDKVTVKLGNDSKTETSKSYTVNTPKFNITAPPIQNDAVLDKTYQRSFTVTNGGIAYATALYLDIEYAKDINQSEAGLRLGNADGTKITPSSVAGKVYRYVIDGALLGADKKLTNGETLTFYEDYNVKACNTTTTYTASWGCDAKNPCQTTKATTQVNLVSGTAKLGKVTFGEFGGFVNSCTPFGWSVTYTNTGTNNLSGAMYNTVLLLSQRTSQSLAVFDWSETNIIEASVDGIPIPGFTGMNERGILKLDFANKLTKEQVKGKELGLRDLDGDGFVDDLPAGASITINFKMQVNCSRLNCDVTKDIATTINNIYELYGRINYTTICGEKKRSDDVIGTGGNRITGSRYVGIVNRGYAPANVYDGVPFEARFSVGYDRTHSVYDNANTRFYYQIELPPGITMTSNSEKWYNGKYPENTKANPLKPIVKQEGNILTITSPKNIVGYFTANFVYKCTENSSGGKIEIPFTFKRIDDIKNGCTTCNSEIFCSNVTIDNVVCPSTCHSGGPTITFSKVERADNSLGYTTYKLEELQKRENISTYDLSKALYLDDIEVTAKAKQNTNKRDLFLKFSIQKNGKNLQQKRLQAKSLKYTIIRANDPKSPYKGELSLEQALDDSDNNTKEQTFRWNFTSVLPDGQLLAGDEIETVATYTVVSKDMTTHDEQIGKEIYFYNTDSGDFELFCNTLVPEMYLLGTTFNNARNRIEYYYMQGCETKDIGHGLNHYGVRLDYQGIMYQSEVRPGIQPKTYSFTLPDGLILKDVYILKNFYIGIGQPKTKITESVVQNGSTYTYTFPEDEGYSILITNSNNFLMYADVTPTCATKPKGQFINTELTYLSDHYHNKPNNILPEPQKSTVKREVFYIENTRPKLSFTNQTGILHGEKDQEEVKIRLASVGITTAPFVWFAVPSQGINVLSLKDGSKEYTPLYYGDGGVWFRIDETGLESGKYKDFTLVFTHKLCDKTDIRVLGGWNCTGYPADPSQYTCGATELKIPFEPLGTEIELLYVQQPTSDFDLCTPQTYKVEINNKAQGSVKNANLTITFPKGMTLSSGSFSVEYPKNSGVWEGIAPTISGQDYTFDLSKHKNYPKNGIPGTYSTTNNNERAILMRWDIETSCDFVSGSTFIAKATAKTNCGKPAKVSNLQLESRSNTIKGATADYVFITDFKKITDDSCYFAIEISCILSGKGTTNQAQLHVTVPKEFIYRGIKVVGGTHQPKYKGEQIAPTGEQIVLLDLPKGMKVGDNIKIITHLKPTKDNICGTKDIKIETHESIEHIRCDKVAGGFCQNITTITGKKEAKLNFELPTLSITKLEATAFDKLEGSITIKNTGLDQSNPTHIGFYCADEEGKPTGYILFQVSFSNTIARGKELKQAISFSHVQPCANMVAVISKIDNCVCSEVFKVFTPQKYKFEVTCPTFKEEKTDCYSKIPTKATYTKAEFEKLGDGKGKIGNHIQHPVVITAENIGTKTSCNNKVTRVYTVIEYQDVNKNKVYDKGTDKIVNKHECKQIFVVNDNIKPTWVSELPKDIIVGCPNKVPPVVELTAKDACDTTVGKIKPTDKKIGTDLKNYVIERTWIAKDVCGNPISHTQKITVRDDMEPKFTDKVLPKEKITVCPSAIPEMEKLHAVDGCGTSLGVTEDQKTSLPKDPKKGYTITRTWKVSAPNGKFKIHKQEIYVIDNQAPKFVEAFPTKDLKFDCASKVPKAAVLTAKDNCDTAVKVIYKEDKKENGPNNVTITRVWTVTDLVGNQTKHVQIITVKDDVKPTFNEKLPEKNPKPYTCASEVPKPITLTAKDNCDTNVKVVYKATKKENGTNKNCPNNYTETRTWTAMDIAGNKTEHTQTIVVKDDIKPTFTTKTLPEKQLKFSCAAKVPKAEVLKFTDNCDKTEKTAILKENKIPGSCPNNYSIERTWTAEDLCGNKEIYKQTITVIDDEKPIFQGVLPPTNLKLSCANEVPTALTLKFTDNCDPNVKEVKATDAIKKGNCKNNFTIVRTWLAKDLCGNEAKYTQTIVVKDDIKPKFQGVLPKDLTFDSAKEVPPAQELEFTDNCDTTIKKVKAKEEKLKETCPNNFVLKRTWIAKDACGNQTTHEQIITVADTIAPTIQKHAEDLTVQCDGEGNQTDLENWLNNYANAVITDNSGKVKWTHNYTGLIKSMGNIGSVTVTFTCSDECDNSVTTKATFTILDTIPPIITKAENKIVECDGKGNVQEYNDWLANNGYATATETCGEITWTNKVEDKTITCLGPTKTYVRFTATDDAGNSSDVVQLFEIRDTTPPTITPAQDLKIECDGNGNLAELQNWLDNHGGATATDVCSENLTWTHDFSGLIGSCTQDTKVTFTVTDNCGNKSETSAVFSISDTTPPEFIGNLPESEITIDPKELTEAPIFTATDICGEAEVIFTQTEYDVKCGNQSSLERKWTARDLCGNEKIFVQNIHLVAPFEVFNNVSPNGDGINELFYIKGIDCYPNNSVQIFDRTGLRVFNKRGYNNTDKSWNGKDQPEGTYFYTIEYTNENNEFIKQNGFIHLEK